MRMTQSNDTIKTGSYDTTINVIGGLKDFTNLFKAMESHFSPDDSVRELVEQRNAFNLRTEKTRSRVERAIRRAFLQFYNQDHKDLIQGVFTADVPLHERELILFWQFALNNLLFREISIKVYMKAYFSGRAGLSKEDVTAYLKEFLSLNKQLQLSWSESTIKTLSTKYLNLMTKLNFLEGVRTKSFRHITASSESLILFLYLARLIDSGSDNILKNEMLPLSFVASDDVKERLKKLSIKGYFNMNYNGVALNIELKHSYKGICDVIYHRA
jgi:hypothetical protein